MRRQENRRAKGSGSLFKRNGKYIYQWRAADGLKKTKLLIDGNGEPVTNYQTAVKVAEKLIQEQVEIQHISSKIEYMTEMAESRNLIERNRTLIADMWQLYLKSPKRPDSCQETLDFYHAGVVSFLKWLNRFHPETKELREISEEFAEEYATDLWEQGISERTYNARISSLKLVFKVLSNEDNPFGSIRRKTKNSKSRNAFSIEQLQAISRKIEDPSYYMLYKPEMKVMLLLMLYTGCRGEDAALMKWSSINLSERTITYIPIKTRRRHPVPVSVPIAENLYLSLCRQVKEDSEYLLPHVSSRFLHNNVGISVDISKLIEAAGIQTTVRDPSLHRIKPIVLYSMHSFRHTFCTMAVNAGIPLSTIQSIVGHTTAGMTAHYSHISMESKQKAVLALENITSASTASSQEPLQSLLTRLCPTQLLTIGMWLDEHLSDGMKKQLLAIV